MPHEYGSGIELDLYWVQIHLIVELLFTYLLSILNYTNLEFEANNIQIQDYYLCLMIYFNNIHARITLRP